MATVANMFFSPAKAFAAVHDGVGATAAILVLASLREARSFVFFSPSTEPVKVLLGFLMEIVGASLPLVALCVCLRGIFWLMGDATSVGRLLSVAAHSIVVVAAMAFVADCTYSVLGDQAADPSGASLLSLGFWTEGSGIVARHVLSTLDLRVLAGAILIAFGTSRVSAALSMQRALLGLGMLWGAYFVVTTSIKLYVS